MREVLFRGKDIDGKWVEGCCIVDEMDTNKVYIGYIFGSDGRQPHDTDVSLVDSKTVCQYTGLTDKNGRKIFEGDIINDIDYGIMKCIYLHGSFVWYKEDGFKIEFMRYIPVIEVIGNIFDNSELIGE